MRRSSGTSPIPRRQIRSGPAPRKLSPSNTTSPRDGGTHPAMVLITVVFPTLLRPKSPTTSPLPMRRSMPCNTWLKDSVHLHQCLICRRHHGPGQVLKQ